MTDLLDKNQSGLKTVKTLDRGSLFLWVLTQKTCLVCEENTLFKKKTRTSAVFANKVFACYQTIQRNNLLVTLANHPNASVFYLIRIGSEYPVFVSISP